MVSKEVITDFWRGPFAEGEKTTPINATSKIYGLEEVRGVTGGWDTFNVLYRKGRWFIRLRYSYLRDLVTLEHVLTESMIIKYATPSISWVQEGSITWPRNISSHEWLEYKSEIRKLALTARDLSLCKKENLPIHMGIHQYFDRIIEEQLK